MRILLDGEPPDFDVATESVASALSDITRRLNQSGKVVLEVRLNGSPLPVDAASRAVGAVELLEVFSSPTRTVAVNVLRGCADHLPRLTEGFSDCARKIRTGDLRGAMVTLEEAVSSWLELERGAESAMTALGLTWDDVIVTELQEGGETRSAGPIVRDVHRLLEEAQRVLEASDYVEFGDLIEYDLPPALRAYQTALHQMADIGEAPRH